MSEVKGKSVRVVWSSLVACPSEMYILRYREIAEESDRYQWRSVKVSSKDTHYTLELQCHKVYQSAVTAKIAGGETPLNHSRWWKVKTGQGNASKSVNIQKSKTVDLALSVY